MYVRPIELFTGSHARPSSHPSIRPSRPIHPMRSIRPSVDLPIRPSAHPPHPYNPPICPMRLSTHLPATSAQSTHPPMCTSAHPTYPPHAPDAHIRPSSPSARSAHPLICTHPPIRPPTDPPIRIIHQFTTFAHLRSVCSIVVFNRICSII